MRFRVFLSEETSKKSFALCLISVMSRRNISDFHEICHFFFRVSLTNNKYSIDTVSLIRCEYDFPSRACEMQEVSQRLLLLWYSGSHTHTEQVSVMFLMLLGFKWGAL